MAVKRRATKRRARRAARRATKPRKAKKRASRKEKRKTKKSQTGSLRQVWNGTAKYTKGGLMKQDLCVNKRGKVLSKKRALSARRAFENILPWLKAVKRARKELGLEGFVPCKRGTKYYQLAKKYYKK
jgi:hypothetical protein